MPTSGYPRSIRFVFFFKLQLILCTSESAGIAATGRAVRVPYTVFYDLVGGAIAALRILGFARGLVTQPEAAPTTAAKTSSR